MVHYFKHLQHTVAERHLPESYVPSAAQHSAGALDEVCVTRMITPLSTYTPQGVSHFSWAECPREND